MKNIELSVIIVSFNTNEITRNSLESVVRSLRTAKFAYEIIVIDNDSRDGSKNMLEEFQKERGDGVKVVLNKENIGFGQGNNQGVKIAQGKYILLLNSDTVVLNNSISKMLEFYKKNEKKIQFLGAKLLNQDLTPQPSAAYFFSLPVVFAALFLKGDYWGLTRFSPNKTTRVDWISGACIMTKKSIYGKLGGFDKDIFMYMEEVDLLYRARKMGLNTYFYPEAQIIHLGSASSGGKTYPIIQVYKGFIYFYKKHYSRFALYLLKTLLKFKAFVLFGIGKLTKNKYLLETYEKAYEVVKMDR